MKPYYEHGGITLYLGDCREILPGLPKVDLVLTDPPYGIGYVHGVDLGASHTKFAGVSVIGDDAPFDPTWLLGFNNICLWGANYYADRLPVRDGRWLFWDKRCGVNVNDHSDGEIAWARGAGGAALRVCRHLWDGFNRDSERGIARDHPTQKPVVVMSWCLSFFPKAKSIIDPYCGSGTTLVACKQRGLKAVGIDIHEPYLEIAAKRLAQEVFDFAGEA